MERKTAEREKRERLGDWDMERDREGEGRRMGRYEGEERKGGREVRGVCRGREENSGGSRKFERGCITVN